MSLSLSFSASGDFARFGACIGEDKLVFEGDVLADPRCVTHGSLLGIVEKARYLDRSCSSAGTMRT